MEGRTAEKSRGSLGPGNDQSRSGTEDLGLAHALLIVVSQNIRDEIRSVHLSSQLQPFIHFGLVVRHMLHSLLFQTSRQNISKRFCQGREPSRSLKKGTELDALEDLSHPRMVFLVLETIERFAERKIADDVKSSVVVPPDDVDLSFIRASYLLMEFADEKVNIGCDEGFLLPQGFFGECMCEQSSHSRVIRITRCGDDAVHAFQRNTKEGKVLYKALVALTVTVDISPSLRAVEREFIRGYSDNLAVFIVQILDGKGELSAEKRSYMAETSRSEGFRSRKGAERMKVDVVYCFENEGNDALEGATSARYQDSRVPFLQVPELSLKTVASLWGLIDGSQRYLRRMPSGQ